MTRSEIEKRIVSATIKMLGEQGWALLGVDDGEDWYPIPDAQHAMDIGFTVDEFKLHFQKKGHRKQVISFVLGNSGWDVISDSTCGDEEFEQIMDNEVSLYAEQFQEESNG